MTIKLRFDPHPDFEETRVWAEDPSLSWIGGLLDNDLQTPNSARGFALKLNDVVAGKRAVFEGSGNGFFFRVGVEHTEVGIDDRPDPVTISVSTLDLARAAEEWAAHLESRLKATGSYM